MLSEKNFYEPRESDHTKTLYSLIESACILSGKLSVSDLLQALVFEARSVFEAQTVWIMMHDTEDDLLKMHIYRGPGEELLKDTTVRPGVGVCGKVFLKQVPEVVMRPHEHPASMFYKKTPTTPIHSLAVCPLTTGETKIGVFGVASERIAASENPEIELDLIVLFAQQVAVALKNATLFDEKKRSERGLKSSVRSLHMLNEVSQSIIKEGKPQSMADQLAHGARVLLDCSAATVLLYKEFGDDDPMIFWTTDGSVSHSVVVSELDLKHHTGLYSEMLRTKKPIRLYNTSDHPRSKGVPESHIHLRGVLGAPLLDSGGNFIGQVMVTDKRDGSRFSQTDEELLVALCNQVAIGIEKAEAYEKQHRIAETLQQAILAVPKSPQGVEIGIAYESAAEAAKVGGDFYEIFELGDGKVGFLVGDVSGKGLEAATITSMVKSTIRAFAYKGLLPASVLTEANRVICEQLKLSHFVTMIYGVLDPGTGKTVISRAGHPEIIVLRNGACTVSETESNLPLGIFADMAYRDDELDLMPDDLIILYTDGLTEAKCDNLFLGERGMIDKLNHAAQGRDPQEITAEMVAIAKEFAGGRLQDDIAIVALRIKN